MTKYLRYLFPALLGGFGCLNAGPASSAPGLVARYPTALREAPGEKSPELNQLAAGTNLVDLGDVSSFLSTVALKDTVRQEPWLKVATPNGLTGWVYAAAIKPLDKDSAAIRKWQLQKRFEAWFGAGLAHSWQSWLETPVPRTDTSFAGFWRTGLHLRDTLNLLLARNVTPDAEHPLPDLYWLSELTPYFIIQQNAAAIGYKMFADYRTVARTAARTDGVEDDQIAQVFLSAFPVDSIESALPAWVFPLSAETSCSNLGQGRHLFMLQSVDRAMQNGTLFLPELTTLKNNILEDILDKSRAYWQPKEKILPELARIRQSGLKCLNARDRLALQMRKAMFDAPESNGIRVNLRSGQ